MNRVKPVLLHLILVVAGFVAAALTGSLVLNLAILAATAADSDPDTVTLAAGLVFSVPFTALFVGYFALFPALFAIVAAELFSLRRAWFFVAAGTAVALLVVYLVRSAGGEEPAQAGLVASLIAAGATAGLAYWAVAGRRSGAWKTVTSPA